MLGLRSLSTKLLSRMIEDDGHPSRRLPARLIKSRESGQTYLATSSYWGERRLNSWDISKASARYIRRWFVPRGIAISTCGVSEPHGLHERLKP